MKVHPPVSIPNGKTPAQEAPIPGNSRPAQKLVGAAAGGCGGGTSAGGRDVMSDWHIQTGLDLLQEQADFSTESGRPSAPIVMISPPQPPLCMSLGKTPSHEVPFLGTSSKALQKAGIFGFETGAKIGAVITGAAIGAGTGATEIGVIMIGGGIDVGTGAAMVGAITGAGTGTEIGAITGAGTGSGLIGLIIDVHGPVLP